MNKWFRGPFTEPESEDDAYGRWRQEMDDNAMTFEGVFEAWMDRTQPPDWRHGFPVWQVQAMFTAWQAAYLAADAEATKRTAQRCVEICHQEAAKHTSTLDGAFTYCEAEDIAQAIAKEYDL